MKRGKTDGDEDRGPSGAAKAEKRCGGDLRGCQSSDDALRASEVGGPAGGAARSQGTGIPGPAAPPREVNAIRAHLGEFGIVVAKGIHNVDRLLEAARDVPPAACPALAMLAGPLRDTQTRIEEVTARVGERQGEDALARRRATVPGVGAISSSAFAATPPTWPPSAAHAMTRLGSA